MKDHKQLVSIVLILVVLIAAALYLVMKMKNQEPKTATQEELVTGIPSKISDEATAGFSKSDDLDSIEKDLKAVDLSDAQ